MSKFKKSLVRKKRKSETRVTYVLSLFHLWLGLLSSLVLFVVCFTGCLYAFKNQIEHIAYGEYREVEPYTSIDLEKAISNYEAQFGVPSQSVVYPESYALEITSLSKQNKGVLVYFAPETGEVIGRQNAGLRDFFHVVLELHRWLLVEEPGKTIVGIFVFVFIYMLVSGVVMWLPKKRKNLKQGLTIRLRAKFYRVNYDLHKVLGFYASLLLFFIAGTGLYVSFHWVKNLTIRSLGGPSITIDDDNLGQSGLSENLSASFNSIFNDLVADEEVQKESKGVNELLILARKESDKNGRIHISLPFSEEGYFTFRIYGNDAFTTATPDVLVYNQYGELKKREMFSEQPLYRQFIAIAKPLHTGEIFGLTSIIIYFIVSLIGCSLPITGFIIWWKKVKK